MTNKNEITKLKHKQKDLSLKLAVVRGKLPDHRSATALVKHYLPLVFPSICGWNSSYGYFYDNKGNKMYPYEITQKIESRKFVDFPNVSINSFASSSSMDIALDEVKQSFLEKEKEKLFQRISFNPSSDGSFVNNILSNLSDNPELDLIVYRHMAWQVKRNLRGLPVDRPLVCILYGEQGTGKSRFWQDLFSVIGQAITTTSLVSYVTGNQAFSTRNQLVIDFSELDAANSNANVARAKQLLTDSTITGKLLYQNEMTAKKVCSYVGSTNYPLSTVFPDSTGYRRFHVVDFTGDVLEDFVNIKSISFDLWCDWWSSIDENCDSPLFGNSYYTKLLSLAQAKIGNELLSMIVKSYVPTSFSAKKQVRVSGKDLYDKYNFYCDRFGVKKKMRKSFDEMIELFNKILGKKFEIRKVQNNIYYVFHK